MYTKPNCMQMTHDDDVILELAATVDLTAGLRAPVLL